MPVSVPRDTTLAAGSMICKESAIPRSTGDFCNKDRFCKEFRRDFASKGHQAPVMVVQREHACTSSSSESNWIDPGLDPFLKKV